MSTSHKRPSSCSQQPSLSSGSNDLPLSIGEHKWARLLLVTFALYFTLLPAWWYALSPLSTLMVACADWIYHFFDPLVSIIPDGKNIKVIATATEQSGFGGQTQTLGLRTDIITYGFPMLIAMIIATRADSIRAKLRALWIGSLVMISITIPVIMIWAKMTSLRLDDRIAQGTMVIRGDQTSFFYYVVHGYAFSQPVVAVGVWLALLMLGLFRDNRRQQARARLISRNAPCPCGSARKYKRCCGRA